ncbi:M48 family metallopeptidase [uncultured Tenacibaculum sp.]|uniref:M48 family metallopeptidase n=1 Tax=uncultured Tenacibaculum sp. TaxID=174713 RepID=UPI002638C490|nr:M48 family metallopeptidase [uncultured Tenacibaculum sp.]
MKSLYKRISAEVPSDYTKPSQSFKKHVWLSVLGLLAFIVLYLGLTIWFGRLAYNLAMDAHNFDGHFFNYLLAFGFGFLSLFMAKSLFFLNKREDNPIHKYVTEKEEPVLFDYLYQLADEAGAPKPNKVFLTDRVNASVSYDISLINLIFPSKKNLEIGLGITNVLSLGELKAVLAHEFGHFAQRSMLLGRYVYVVQQIAARIVGKRDAFDSFLAGLSRIDLRIAWIGWILSILVWSVRSFIEICFRVVVVAERALSREMEFQADLVAVSLTGSDALIHALYKLQVADEAHENAIQCMSELLGEKKAIKDMYTLQSNYIERMAVILNDPAYGKSPKVPDQFPEENRIFANKKYNPPKMWATHPADIDRENNAKKNYIFEEIDERSSWELFSDPKFYREEMTKRLISTAKVETIDEVEEEGIKYQNKSYFDWTFLEPEYNSNFLNRFPFQNFESYEDLLNKEIKDVDLSTAVSKLYPHYISNDIQELQELEEEIIALEVSKDESLTLEKRKIWHRGNEVKRKDIPEILKELKEEVAVIREKLKEHDVLCRSTFQKLAKEVDQSWADYHERLIKLVHYSEHTMANLKDVMRKYNNVMGIALADGNVSDDELVSILSIGDTYHITLRRIYKHAETFTLNNTLLKNMNIDHYNSLFEEFKLPPPSKENINEWVQVVDGWASVALAALNKLRNESLELLLETEKYIKQAYAEKLTEKTTAVIKGFPDRYDTLIPGKERKLQTKLGIWDRFVTGDGIIPSIAKFGISGGIVFAAIFFGNRSQKLPLYIYNGLQTTVSVTVGSEFFEIEPNYNEELLINYGTKYIIKAKNSEGQIIDSLNFSMNEHSAYMYNVANAAVMMKYPVFYGVGAFTSPKSETELLNENKIFPIKADYILVEPPQEISMPSGVSVERKDVLLAYSEQDPQELLSILKDEDQISEMIETHVKWDDDDSKQIVNWLYSLRGTKEGLAVLNSRLNRNPKEFISLRALQDLSDSTAHKDICNKHVELAREEPDNPDLYYLSIRCIKDEKLKDSKFLEGYKKWNQHNWLAYASGYIYTQKNNLEEAYEAYRVAAKGNPTIRSMIALDVERIKRILNLKGKKRYRTIIKNEQVKYYQNLELGKIENGENNPDYIFYLINNGKIDEAYKLVKKYGERMSYVNYFIAASKGVKKDLRDKLIRNLDINQLNYNSVWPVLGLHVLDNKDYTDLLPIFQPLDMEAKDVNKLISLIKQRDFSGVDNRIQNLTTQWKAQVYVLSSIIQKGNIPTNWKKVIKGGLFISEKPYLGL